MNSLIQSLFMTPEFRRAVYEWSFEERFVRDLAKHEADLRAKAAGTSPIPDKSPSPTPGAAAKAGAGATPAQPETPEAYRERKERMSIPLQLQMLFARLQLSNQRAVKTTKLTKSFGWTDAESFTQHDVQELCRVLFDALEEAMAGTYQAQLINELFAGKLLDYVLCTECGKLSARRDAYLDVPLVIKPFGQQKPVASVQEALANFVQPEILEGGNAYHCDRCNKRVTARKGLSFLSFPYILMLQLKRFDFDYATMKRIKLHDRVEFPRVLDLNPFLEGTSDAEQLKKRLDAEAAASASAAQAPAPEPAPAQEIPVPAPAPAPAPVIQPTPERPYVYELYAILIHRGSAIGGHYFAYIKPFGGKDNKWFEFNDSSVSEITDVDIATSFGEGEKDTTGYGSYGASAYMLLYRRVDVSRNVGLPTAEELPAKMKDTIEEEKQKAKRKVC